MDSLKDAHKNVDYGTMQTFSELETRPSECKDNFMRSSDAGKNFILIEDNNMKIENAISFDWSQEDFDSTT